MIYLSIYLCSYISLSFHLSVCLSICLSVYLPLSLYIYIFTGLFICILFLSFSVRLPVCLSFSLLSLYIYFQSLHMYRILFLSIYLSIYLCSYLFPSHHLCLSVCLCLSLSIYIYNSTCTCVNLLNIFVALTSNLVQNLMFVLFPPRTWPNILIIKFGWLFVCLFGFYGITTFVDYLMPNPF